MILLIVTKGGKSIRLQNEVIAKNQQYRADNSSITISKTIIMCHGHLEVKYGWSSWHRGATKGEILFKKKKRKEEKPVMMYLSRCDVIKNHFPLFWRLTILLGHVPILLLRCTCLCRYFSECLFPSKTNQLGLNGRELASFNEWYIPLVSCLSKSNTKPLEMGENTSKLSTFRRKTSH